MKAVVVCYCTSVVRCRYRYGTFGPGIGRVVSAGMVRSTFGTGIGRVVEVELYDLYLVRSDPVSVDLFL